MKNGWIIAVLCVVPNVALGEPSMAKLEAALVAACPIDGFSVGSWTNKSTWRVDFKAAATAANKTACAAVVAAFDQAAAANQTATYVRTLAIFRGLTAAEHTALMQAATAQLAQGNGQFLRWLDLARASGRVDISDSATVAFKSALVSSGVLTQPRADLVFAPSN